jgi:hypothetical protein
MDRKIVEAMLQGKSNRQICVLFKKGDRKVRKIRVLATEYGYLCGANPMPPYPEALFPDEPDGRGSRSSEPSIILEGKRDWIVDRLEARWHPITIFEELGVPVSRASFYRFLLRHDLCKINEKQRVRVIPEIIHQPGEALQLDWGKLRDVIDPKTGKKRTLWAFVGVLGFSRYMMVRLVWTNETQITILAVESMFQELGGVPFKVTSDNPKCFAIEASVYEPILNPAFERFAASYQTLIECLPPADPQKKGKVERLMPFVRRLYESYGPEWKGIEESQSYMNNKVDLANQRIHGTTRCKPGEQFLNFEASALKSLPALAYSPEEVIEAKVRQDGHVRYRNKYYSLPETLINQSVMILASQTQVSIYHNGKLIEVHTRIAEDNNLQSKSTKEHHRKPWERSMEDHSMYRARAQAIGSSCDQLILILLNQGQGFIDTRKVWGILSLDKSYSKDAVNKACSQALELQSYSYQTVKRLLKLLPSPATVPANETTFAQNQQKTSTHKFARPMSVYEEQLKLLH